MKKWMRSVLEGVRRHWRKADAQDLVEYALLLVLVSLAAVASVRTLGQRVADVFTTAKTDLGTASLGIGATVAVDNAAATAAGTSAFNAFAAALAAGNGSARQTDLNSAGNAFAAAALADLAAGFQAAIGNFAAANASFATAQTSTAAGQAALTAATSATNVAATTTTGGFGFGSGFGF